MTYCGKCGAQVQDGVKFCQGCGAAVETKVENNAQQAQPASQPPQNDFSQKLQNL
ncbi:MAG: zinc ribbon domain-containing protein, partial [Clostridia bacterium]|nr:zinc ribbon domain-containing protein [Clostridia bacterium]